MQSTPIKGFILMPNRYHRFKPDSRRLPFETRLELIQEAIKGQDNVSLWLDDADGSGYTADLMRSLYLKHPDERFSFVIGSDNLKKLNAWHDYDWLREHLHFIVIPRPNQVLHTQRLGEIQHTIVDIQSPDISSTDIRARIKNGQSIKGLVPSYLEDKIIGLYRSIDDKSQ